MCLALREGLLHHRSGDRVVILGDGVAHTLHGNMRRIGCQVAQAQDDKGELEERMCFRMTQDMIA